VIVPPTRGGGGGWRVLEVSSDGSYVDLTTPHTRNLLGPQFLHYGFMIEWRWLANLASCWELCVRGSHFNSADDATEFWRRAETAPSSEIVCLLSFIEKVGGHARLASPNKTNEVPSLKAREAEEA
jgi:hypothetical protein